MIEYPENATGIPILPLVSRLFNVRKLNVSTAKAHRQLDNFQLAV
jgi:hypothetical protein